MENTCQMNQSTRQKVVKEIVSKFKIYGVHLSNDEIKGLLTVRKDKFNELIVIIASQHNIMLV